MPHNDLITSKGRTSWASNKHFLSYDQGRGHIDIRIFQQSRSNQAGDAPPPTVLTVDAIDVVCVYCEKPGQQRLLRCQEIKTAAIIQVIIQHPDIHGGVEPQLKGFA